MTHRIFRQIFSFMLSLFGVLVVVLIFGCLLFKLFRFHLLWNVMILMALHAGSMEERKKFFIGITRNFFDQKLVELESRIGGFFSK